MDKLSMKMKMREPMEYAPETKPVLPAWLKCAVCNKDADLLDKGTSYCLQCHHEHARTGNL